MRKPVINICSSVTKNNMKYRYEDLSAEQFEDLVIAICQNILGMSTKGFTAGKDQGRDAKFIGVANEIPSRAAPWNGKVIIQAKHTNGYNKAFSESDFFGAESNTAVINKEIPRIKKLIDDEKLEYYILFANRKLTAHFDDIISTYISENTGLNSDSILLCDIKQIDIYVKQYPLITEIIKIDPSECPLIVGPDEISEVIEAFNAQRKGGLLDIDKTPPEPRTKLEDKNIINNLTEEFSKHLKKIVIKESRLIDEFLADPRNENYNELYQVSIDEFQSKIIDKGNGFKTFDSILNYIIDLLINRDPVLNKYKRLTRLMLYYMYWNCDIGKNSNDTTK